MGNARALAYTLTVITERQLLDSLELVFECQDLLAVEPFHRRAMYYLDEAVAQNLVSARRAAVQKEQVNKHVQTLWAQKHEAIYAEREDPFR
jgi:hypothetical protein